MLNPMTSTVVPSMILRRSRWLAALLGWALAVAVSLFWHMDALKQQSLEVASAGARNLFNMVVLTRAWNAEHGGVYVPVSPIAQPNPYLKHPRRDLLTTDGQKLTMINPAFMTRQLSELAQAKGGTVFHITSLNPIRPKNQPDDWERIALQAFETGEKERVTLLEGMNEPARLRFMAPLIVKPPCMVCHAEQGYKVGDVRGGISVTVPIEPMLVASRKGQKQSLLIHAAVFLLVALMGWGLLELLRRRWLDLSENLTTLEITRNAMQASNQQLALARDAAESASRSKSAFLGAMSHELRTPLNGILGFAHLLQYANLPVKAHDQAKRISEQGSHLLSLVNEVMEFTHLDGLSRPEKLGSFDLANVLAELADELHRTCAAKGLRVRVEHTLTCAADAAAPASVLVVGERGWLIGCLRPILANAVKFTEQGEVLFEAKREPAGPGACRVHVKISDSGIGIAEADRDKIFQPFRQIDDATTRRYGGLGLGLAISARYAALLDARLSFDSTPGDGSRFCFDWLAQDALAQANAAGGDEAEAELDELNTFASNNSPLDLDEAMAELAQLLGQDDLRSATVLNAAWMQMVKVYDAEQLAQLRQQIERFDYPAALETLRVLQR